MANKYSTPSKKDINNAIKQRSKVNKSVESGTSVESSEARSVVKTSTRFNWSFGKFLSNSYSASEGISISKFIFVLFFAFNLFAFIYSQRIFTFSSILDFIGSYSNDVSISEFFVAVGKSLVIEGDWGIFDFFRNFINVCGQILGFLLGAIGGLLDVLRFIFSWFSLVL